jgi:hypothetical protein
MIRIVTSSFYTTLPPLFARISIARWAPKGHRDLPTVREFAPGDWFRTIDEDEYRERYIAQLTVLDARAIVRKIEDLGAGRPTALLCWERPRDHNFCHRGYVSAWLHVELGLDVPEYGRDCDGSGHSHPKLPPQHRFAAPSLFGNAATK